MRFIRCQRGAAAIEYGLLAALIAGAIVLSIGLLGDSLRTTYTRVTALLPNAGAAGHGPPAGAGNGAGNNGNGLGNGGPNGG